MRLEDCAYDMESSIDDDMKHHCSEAELAMAEI